MAKAQSTRRRLLNDPNLSQLFHQPLPDPINHVDPLRERPTDDPESLRDAPSKPLSHVQAYMLLRQKPQNFDSINPKILQQYTYITEGYEKFLKDKDAEFDKNHSVLDRVLSWIVISPTKTSVYLLSTFMPGPSHTLTDTGANQSYGIRPTLMSSLTMRWQETHNTTTSSTKPKDPNRRPHQNLPKPSQIFCGLKIIQGSESVKCVCVCT